MRRTVWLFILLTLAGLFAYGSLYFPGHAQFTVAGIQVSMNIYFFMLLFVCLLALGMMLWRFYRALVNVPSRFGSWRTDRRENKALEAIKVATIALHEGRWNHADKAAKIASRSQNSAGIAALIGAASAQAQGQTVATQNWLKELSSNPDFADAAALQQAQIALDNHDASGALTALDAASATVRKHSTRYKELRIQAHADAAHWHEVLQITKDKNGLSSLAATNNWFAQAARALCADASLSTVYLQSLYKEMPDAVRADDATLSAYVQALLTRNEKLLARRAIEAAMRTDWRPRLLNLYVEASDESSYTEQLKALDEWDAKQPKDAALLCAAGQLCFKATIWGRAKANFQTSLAVQPSVAAHYGLAQTYRALDDVTHAQDEERKAALLAVS